MRPGVPTSTLLSLIGTLACLVGYSVSPVELSTPLLLAIAALVGLPHGGADVIEARDKLKGRETFVLYLFLYIAIAASVWALWNYFPLFTTIGFFLLSWFHFSEERDAGDGRLSFLFASIEATIVLAVPFLSTVANPWSIVSDLSRTGVPVLRESFGYLLAATMIGVAASTFISSKGKFSELPILRLATVVLLFCTFFYLPVHLSFTVYFILWHAPEHMRCISEASLKVTRGTVAVVITTLIPIASAIGYLVLHRGDALDVVLNRTFFIGLASLTVPHVLNGRLIEVLRFPALSGRVFFNKQVGKTSAELFGRA